MGPRQKQKLADIADRARRDQETIVLYTECEMDKRDREVLSLFSRTEKWRAAGSGISPVVVSPDKQVPIHLHRA